MKFLCVSVVLLVAVASVQAFFTEGQLAVARKLTDECHKELGGSLPEDFATKMQQGDLSLNDETSKCTIQCIFSKVGFTSAEGVASRAVLVDKLSKGNPTEKAEKFADLCQKNDGDTKCDKAHALYECYHKNKSVFD